MKPALRVLIVEDSEFDAQMMASLVRKAGFEVACERVETRAALLAALAGPRWDVVLSDYNLPDFSALEALQIVQASGLDIPFIIISGGIGEATAVEAMKAGAHDYLMKGNLSRLGPVVEREVREAANRAERAEAREALRESELRNRLLWESCPDAVILMDTESKIHFANPAVEEVFGYQPGEVIGQSIALLQPEAPPGDQRFSLQRALQAGERKLSALATETLGRRKDGTEIVIEVSFSELELRGQRRFVGFIRDITGRKKAEAELRENQEQFRVAREIQQHLFPKAPPQLPGFDIAGVTYPADSTGGDYFDFLPMLHERHGFIVADVTGHGVGPALLMAETRAYLRTLAGNREDVGEILTRANGILAEDVGHERFVTLFLGRLDPKTLAFFYANAGHPAGYVLDAGGAVKETLRRTSVPLGIMPDTRYRGDAFVLLAPGDLVLLLTDGIEEATAPDDSFFGIERALDVVRARRDQPAKEILKALYQAVRDFSGNAPQIDDVTAILIKVL
ncbi:MAG: PAS domain S-box protein [Pedosphaera sp.]|nr:PAS domain S-box protein [Pedosphaera sp.]